jgi:hypothetical protein
MLPVTCLNTIVVPFTDSTTALAPVLVKTKSPAATAGEASDVTMVVNIVISARYNFPPTIRDKARALPIEVSTELIVFFKVTVVPGTIDP